MHVVRQNEPVHNFLKKVDGGLAVVKSRIQPLFQPVVQGLSDQLTPLKQAVESKLAAFVQSLNSQ